MSKHQSQPCHSEPSHHDGGCDHQAALITADAHISVGGDCNPLLTTNVHADVLPCDGGLADLHHDHSGVGICFDPDFHV
jgi:hypothetical protein